MKIMLKSFYTIVCATAVALSLCTCSEEDNDCFVASESREPITFTVERESFPVSVPLTRVTDTDNTASVSSSWTDGDKICVSIESLLTDSRQSTVCTLNANGSVAACNPQLYWQATGSYSVRAWYSNIGNGRTTDNAVGIADQTSGVLPYVLTAEPVTYAYAGKKSGSIQLRFVHQLAKVRVKLLDKGGNDINHAGVAVWLRNCYTSCSVSEGVVKPVGKADGYIAMMPPGSTGGFFEANVVPDDTGTSRQTYALEIKRNNKTTGVDFATPVSFHRGKVYTLTVTVE